MEHQILLQNVKCGGCASSIVNKLSSLPGIDQVVVDHENGSVKFNYDLKENLQQVEHKLKDMGYPPIGTENTLKNKASSYINCAIGKINS